MNRRLRRLLRGPSPSSPAPFHAQRAAAGRAVVVVRAFFALHVLVALWSLSWLDRFHGAAADWLWPVAWLGDAGDSALLLLRLLHGAAVAAAVAAAVRPRSRALRLAAVALFLAVLAAASSYGKISHGWHAWLWAGAVLALCPVDGAAGRALRQTQLTFVWLAQALLLLFYALTGFWKLVALAQQLAQGQRSWLAVDALAVQIANRALETGGPADAGAAGRALVEHAWLGPFLVAGTFYLELCAPLIAFRPAAQRVWGALLVAFHAGIWLAMGIEFAGQALAVTLLFVCSPFAGASVGALPLVGALVRALRRGRGRP